VGVINSETIDGRFMFLWGINREEKRLDTFLISLCLVDISFHSF